MCSLCAAKVATLKLEPERVPQNVVLRTAIVHGSCGADAIKLQVLRTMKWFLQSENTLMFILLDFWYAVIVNVIWRVFLLLTMFRLH